MTEEKAKSLIGSKVRGFKFESETDEVFYTRFMDKLIGEIGKITDYFDDCFTVKFKDNYWGYPASLIEAHLVEEGISDDELNKVDSVLTEIEQLKAEKAELVNVLKKLTSETYKTKQHHNNSKLKECLENSEQTLEKHGK